MYTNIQHETPETNKFIKELKFRNHSNWYLLQLEKLAVKQVLETVPIFMLQ